MHEKLYSAKRNYTSIQWPLNLLEHVFQNIAKSVCTLYLSDVWHYVL